MDRRALNGRGEEGDWASPLRPYQAASGESELRRMSFLSDPALPSVQSG